MEWECSKPVLSPEGVALKLAEDNGGHAERAINPPSEQDVCDWIKAIYYKRDRRDKAMSLQW